LSHEPVVEIAEPKILRAVGRLIRTGSILPTDLVFRFGDIEEDLRQAVGVADGKIAAGEARGRG
jgi:hypothetical protein